MRKADGLSEKLDWEIGVEKDNEEHPFFPSNHHHG